MKRILLAIGFVFTATSAFAAPDPDHTADRSPSAFPVITPAANDYWILTDTSNAGLLSKVATTGIRAAAGLGTTDNVTFGNVTASGGTLTAGVGGTTQGALVLKTNTDPVYTFGIMPAALPSEIVALKFPPAMPTADNSLLNFDINGTGGWTDPASLTAVTASGFDGNLAVTDDTLQEVAQKLDDLNVTGGYTNLTSFLTQTAWRVFYSDGSGDVKELALGSDGEYLKSNGAAAAPSWATPAGSGDMILATAQTVTGKKTFENSDIALLGSSTGATTFASANAGATDYTLTFPAATGTVALTSQLFNPAAPGAIGGTTPAAGTFTALTYATLSTTAADGSRYSEWPNNTSRTCAGGGVEETYNEAGALKACENDTEYDILLSRDLDDTPVDNDTATAPTSNALVDGLAGKQDTDTDLTDLADGSLTASKVAGSAVATGSKAANYTIGTDSADESYGGTIYVTSAATITAPAVLAGMNFTVVTIGDIAVSLDMDAADKMILDGVTLADGDKATNSSKAGDTITCQYYSADGFYCWSGTVLGGHWTDGN